MGHSTIIEVSKTSVRVQQGINGGGQFGAGPVLRAHDLAGDPTFPGNHVNFGDYCCAVIRSDFFAAVDVSRKVDAVLGKEFLIRGRIVVPAQSQHRSALARNALLKRV